ncbi:MAG: hypothetical protein LUD79_05785 [Oscillospiraceae bacterium]|nr:hypothetical protein [Oscillospiraceae bacterium]
MTLILMWIFLVISLGIALFLNIFYPTMPIMRFFGAILVPVILTVYFRILYGRASDYERHQAEAAGEPTHPTAKPKKRKKKH